MVSPASSSSSVDHKRKQEEDQAPRKQRVAVDPERCLVKVESHTEHVRASRNWAYLPPSMYDKLFGGQSPDGHCLKVANLVYRAVRDLQMKGAVIDLNDVCYQDVSVDFPVTKSGIGSVWISPYDCSREPYSAITRLHCSVDQWGELNHFGSIDKPKVMLFSRLHDLIKDHLQKEVLSLRQSFFIHDPVHGPLKIRVDGWVHEELDEVGDIHDLAAVSRYGVIGSCTELSLSSARPHHLIIAEEADPRLTESFTFQVIRVRDIAHRSFSGESAEALNRDSWKKGAAPIPFPLPLADATQRIRDRLGGKWVMIGDREMVSGGPDWEYEVKLTAVIAAPHIRNRSLSGAENPRVFNMNRHHIKIIAGNGVILTDSKANAGDAVSMQFEITDFHRERVKSGRDFEWLSVDGVLKDLKKKSCCLPEEGRIVVEQNGAKFLLTLMSASGPLKEGSGEKPFWKFSGKTSIQIFSKKELDVHVFDNQKPVDLKRVTVKVAEPKPKGMAALIAKMGGDEQEQEKTVIEVDELKEMFLRSIPRNGLLFDRQSVRAISGKGIEMEFTIEHLLPNKQPPGTPYYGHLFLKREETEIQFEGDKESGILIRSKPVSIEFENIGQKLLEFGIGGMTGPFIDLISDMVLARSTYGEHLKRVGQRPSRGVILHGPPGTGKTLIARKLGEALGISKERIQLLTGSQFWTKWLGETERKVREMFAPAEQDWKRFGKESPMHLIVIDECDSIFRDRSKATQNHDINATNQFLAKFDGLGKDGEGSPENLIVVGLTNSLDSIDEAVKRPGRLFPHIEIKIPNSKGRKEIFEIHTKSLRDSGYLGNDVDLDLLVQQTVGKTGAFIEGVAAAAVLRSSRRLWKEKVSVEQIADSPLSKVGQDDFMDAIGECSGTKKEGNVQLSLPAAGTRDQLRALGLPGLSQEVVQFVDDLKIAQKYRQHLYKIKQPFPKGALFYGPSGTGKTSLAKALKQLFELQSDRYHFLQASSLWPQHGSDLKKELQKLLKPAIDAAGDLKEEAPLHLLVIDQIDSLYLHRRETDTHEQSVLNQFMNELEAFFEESGQAHHLVVIGIAQRTRYGIPDGIIKHGRFGKHIEFGRPDRKGREEIFRHYLERLKLSPDVKIEELVNETRDRSASFLEGLVNNAVALSLRRASRAGLEEDRMELDDEAALTMKDFVDSFNEMKGDEKWRDFYV